VPGLWWDNGLEYFGTFKHQYRLAWFLPLGLLALLGERRRAALIAWAFVAPFLAYVLAVGGDQFEFRFLVHVFPLVYWLLVEGVRRLWQGSGSTRHDRSLKALSVTAVLLLLFTTQQGFGRFVGEHSRIEGIDYYATRRSEEGRFLARLIEGGTLPRDLWIAVGGAGALPYYTGWPTVDIRGLNDEYVAHMPLAARGAIGHERRAPLEYLVRRGVVVVDVYNQLVHDELPARKPFPEEKLRLKVIPLEGRYLVFGTPASDEELARVFPGLEIRELAD